MSVDGRRGRAQPGRHASGHQTRAALTRLLEPVVAGAGFDLEEVIVTPAGRRRQVRVVIDADGGVSLDDVALVSRDVSAALDDGDALGSEPYVLEVTSPGIDRPLTRPRHWRRATGRLVRARLADGAEITGRVHEAGETAVVLDAGSGPRGFGYDELVAAVVQVEFNRRGEQDDLTGDED